MRIPWQASIYFADVDVERIEWQSIGHDFIYSHIRQSFSLN
jgi:hypothetical protein